MVRRASRCDGTLLSKDIAASWLQPGSIDPRDVGFTPDRVTITDMMRGPFRAGFVTAVAGGLQGLTLDDYCSMLIDAGEGEKAFPIAR